MKSRVYYHLYIFAIYFLCSCQPGKKDAPIDINIGTLKKISRSELIIRPAEIHKQIIALCNHPNNHSPESGLIEHFYQTESSFLWLGQYIFESQTDSLVYWLENSAQHGLNPEVFHLSKIKEDIKKIETLRFEKKDNINHLLAELEYNLTAAYIKYACGLSFGFIDPHKILNNLEDEVGKNGKPLEPLADGTIPKKELYSTPLKSPDQAFITNALIIAMNKKAATFLEKIQPTDKFYISLQAELEKLRKIQETKFTSIPYIGDTLLKTGDRNKIISLIHQRLKITGEISPDANISSADDILTPELLKAINDFRRKNRIAYDSSIGNYTIKLLNRPIDHYTSCLRINMERLRWKPKQEKGNRYIVVNIAAAMLQAIDAKVDTILEMKVCVGNKNNKTPLLSSTIKYVELNPYWNVPQSIIMKEIIPSYKKDTTYFTRNKFRIYDKEGREISPHSISWEKYPKGIPYEVKQDNKDGNSLGRMIFRFPNIHDVYLHDTPAKYAFKANNRAISHGCVRLESPVTFAFFLLGDKDSIIEDRIRLAIGLSALSEKGKKLGNSEEYKELEYYIFKTPLPLFLEYYTNYLSKEGELSYCEDPYNYDFPLLEALDEKSSTFIKNN